MALMKGHKLKRGSVRWFFTFLMLAQLPTLCYSNDIKIHGAGATLPLEVYEAWMPAFDSNRREFVTLDMEFRGIGSGEGNKVAKGELGPASEYVGSDLELTEEDYKNHTDLQMVPVMGGAVVMGYNLPGINFLVLSREHIVGIYNGSFTWWNDSSIQEHNNETLPKTRIRVVARSDKSGTTEIFTRALSSFSEEWNATYGIFSDGVDNDNHPIVWPDQVISLFGKTTRGASGAILSYRGAIGYVSAAEAKGSRIPYAKLINKYGRAVSINSTAIKKTMLRRRQSLGRRMTGSLVDDDIQDAYPIVGYTYIIVRMHTIADCNVARELMRFIDWMMYDDFAREDCREMDMAPLDTSIAELVVDRIFKSMTCGGRSVYQMMIDQKYDEEISKQTWRLPVFISAPVVAVLIFLLLGYIVFQQLKLRKAILTDEWKIAVETIIIRWSRKLGRVGSSRANSVISLSPSMVSNFSYSWANHVMAIGTWKEGTVCLRDVEDLQIAVEKIATKKLLLWMRDKVIHVNVLKFHGITYMDDEMFLVSEHAPKGTLTDVVQNDKYSIDDNIKFSLALDVVGGMIYLHDQGIIHGNLMSECCLIDHRWNVKVADWEYYRLESNTTRRNSKVSKFSKVSPSDVGFESDPNVVARRHFWTAPEILRFGSQTLPTKSGDVYSFAIVLVEIFTREDPYTELSNLVEPKDIIETVLTSGVRPTLNTVTPEKIHPIMLRCWDNDASKRPTFSQVNRMLKVARPTKKSVMDCMMEALEGYVTKLEEKVQERTAELATANQNMENLLHQILPPSVATKLSKGEPIEPESFDSVTIFFSDIVGFTTISSDSKPLEIVTMLNDLYTIFDSVIDKHDVYKVETIGDAYMVISGLPKRNGIYHAGHIATMALDLLVASGQFKIRHKPNEKLKLRAGIHSGPVVAGVVGRKMPRYCLFGDTVNTASRMESTSVAMKIQVSEPTEDLLKQITGYNTEIRGEIDVKGKGKMRTFFLLSKEGYQPGVATSTLSYQTKSAATETEAKKVEGPWASVTVANETSAL